MKTRQVLVLLATIGSACGGAGSGTEPADKPLPDEADLCKLTIGYPASGPGVVNTDVLGTHSDDVRAVLGEPSKRTDTEFTYEWCVGAGCTKHVLATLIFMKADRCYTVTGMPITPPYWLSDVKVEGFALPGCWHTGSENPGNCPECLSESDVTECK